MPIEMRSLLRSTNEVRVLVEARQDAGTILVITALSEERRAVLSFFPQESLGTGEDETGNSYIYGMFECQKTNKKWKIVLPSPTKAGNVKSATKTALSLSIKPDVIFLVGVAGGFPGKVNMYDVVVAERVFFVEPAKIDENNNYITRPDQHKTTAKLLSRAQTLQDLGGWQRLLHPWVPNEDVQVWVEPIAAGEKLVATSEGDDFARIRKSAPRAVAVENEGFGVLEAAHEAAVNALVIRGISDLLDNRPIANEKTSQTIIEERVGPDPMKLKAARHAAAFMFGLLELIDEQDAREIAETEDGFVDVRIKWKDLQDLARGRTLTISIADGAPIRDIHVKSGSVEVEFRTLKLFAALLYAAWIEQNIFEEMVDLQPDQVDTLIDTSDPDVSNIFKCIRMLNSSNASFYHAGKKMLEEMSNTYPFIKTFSRKLTAAVEKRRSRELEVASSNISNISDPSVESSRKMRIRVSVTDEIMDRIINYQHRGAFRSRSAALSEIMGKLIKEFDESRDMTRMLQNYSSHHKYDGRVSFLLSGETAATLDRHSREIGLRPAELARSLLNTLRWN